MGSLWTSIRATSIKTRIETVLVCLCSLLLEICIRVTSIKIRTESVKNKKCFTNKKQEAKKPLILMIEYVV